MNRRFHVRRPRETPIDQRARERVRTLLGVRGVKLELRHDVSFPDNLFFVPGGRPLLIEMKRPGAPADDGHQNATHAYLRSIGYAVEVHDSVDGVLQAVSRAVEAARRTAEGG